MVEHVIYIKRPLPISSSLKFLVGHAERDGTDRWQTRLAENSRRLFGQEFSCERAGKRLGDYLESMISGRIF